MTLVLVRFDTFKQGSQVSSAPYYEAVHALNTLKRGSQVSSAPYYDAINALNPSNRGSKVSSGFVRGCLVLETDSISFQCGVEIYVDCAPLVGFVPGGSEHSNFYYCNTLSVDV